MLLIIDRHIANLFLLFFFVGLVVFSTLFLAVDSIGSFIRYGTVGTDVFLRFYVYFTPEIVCQMMPMACLAGTIFTLSSLNRTNELVALFGVGMSLARISAPILVLVSTISVAFFWVGDRILPKLVQKKNYIKYVEIKKRPGLYSTVKTNKIWYKSDDILFNIKTLNANDSTAQGLTMYYLDSDWKLVRQIQARSVKIRDGLWDLQDGLVTQFTDASSFPQTQKFKMKMVTMGEGVNDIQSTAHSFDIMGIDQLGRFIKRNKEAGLDTLSYEVDYHRKFGFAFAALVMALLGIPFSVGGQRSGGKFMNIGLCIGFGFAYWFLFSSSLTLGRNGLIPPAISAWAPNVIFSGASIYFLRRLKK